MKTFERETPGAAPSEECARALIETVPLVMRFIRTHMRRHSVSGLSVPQFRSLLFLRRRDGCSLSDLAEHIGLMPPSTSKLVEELVSRGLATRRECLKDRRRVMLGLTREGEWALRVAREAAEAQLAARMAALPADRCRGISRAMQHLQEVFVTDRDRDVR